MLDAETELPVSSEELLERVAALKHDLGKYVAWTSANLEEEAWTGPVEPELLEALRDDLLRTRRRGDESEPCWSIWSRLTSDLERPWAYDELRAVDAGVQTLRGAEQALIEGDLAALGELRAQLRDAQMEIRRQLSALLRRLRSEVHE